MLRRAFVLLLPGLLLVQCAPAGPLRCEPQAGAPHARKQEGVPVFRTRAELDSAFAAWVEMAQNPLRFWLAGGVENQWRQLAGEALWGEFARRCSAAYREDGLLELTLEYRDFVRYRAALRSPGCRSGLSQAEQNALDALVRRTRALLRPGMSEFDKLLVIHDDLVQRARYDSAGGGNVLDILQHGSGSCEAYSSMLCVMLAVAEIPARLVTGSAGGELHAWNLVRLGQEWYHVDATWDDPVVGDGRRQVVSHRFCCLSDAEMAATHRWNRASYPASAQVNAWYYRRLGIYFDSFDAYWQAAMAAYRRGARSFEGYLAGYGSPELFQQNLQLRGSAAMPARLSWTGPESSAGPVIVTF